MFNWLRNKRNEMLLNMIEDLSYMIDKWDFGSTPRERRENKNKLQKKVNKAINRGIPEDDILRRLMSNHWHMVEK